MLLCQYLTLVVFVIHFSIIVLFAMLFELIDACCLAHETFLGVALLVGDPELTDRVARKLVALAVHFSSHSLVVTTWDHAHPVDLHVGQHLGDWALDVLLQVIPIVVRITPWVSVRLNFTRQ